MNGKSNDYLSDDPELVKRTEEVISHLSDYELGCILKFNQVGVDPFPRKKSSDRNLDSMCSDEVFNKIMDESICSCIVSHCNSGRLLELISESQKKYLEKGNLMEIRLGHDAQKKLEKVTIQNKELKNEHFSKIKGLEKEINQVKANLKDKDDAFVKLQNKFKHNQKNVKDDRITYLSKFLFGLVLAIIFCSGALYYVKEVADTSEVTFQFSFNIAEFIGSLLGGIGILFAGITYTYKTLKDMENK